MSKHSTKFRTVEFKLYPNQEQADTLSRWLRLCCRTYNAALEHRIAAYRETKKSARFYKQCDLLVQSRSQDAELRSVPSVFSRDALRRVERGMESFFRRLKFGVEKPGFPRFRSQRRYNSMEYCRNGYYVRGQKIRIPKLGLVKARGPFDRVPKTQKLLRIIRRAHGWYAQVLVEFVPEQLPKTGETCGLDLGLASFVTLDTGEAIGNPRVFRKAAKKLRKAQQVLSRRKKGSRRRRKAVKIVARVHERVARQRIGFCHRLSRLLVDRFDRIAVENLNIKGLAASWLAKSVSDAAWGIFLNQLRYKAEYAGRVIVEVDPRGTSQTCPQCAAVARKELSERVHRCLCGCVMGRDHAAAIVIRSRAFGSGRGESVRPVADEQAGSLKRIGV